MTQSLKQEHFNKAYLAVIAQGRPSMRDGSCLYRGPDNTKCAFGHLLSDEQYHPDMDRDGGLTSGQVFRDFSLTGFDPDIHFYRELQNCHDLAYANRFVDDFKARMHILAEQQGLTVPCA